MGNLLQKKLFDTHLGWTKHQLTLEMVNDLNYKCFMCLILENSLFIVALINGSAFPPS